MGAHDGASGGADSPGRQQHSGEAKEVAVHVRFSREGDIRRLPVGSLHQADGRGEGEELLQVRFGAAEVGLEAEAEAAPVLAHGPEDFQGAVHVGRGLHVHPDQGPGVARRHDALQALAGAIESKIEAKLRKLHGDFRVEPPGPHRVQDPEVVIRHGIRPCSGGDVLSQEGEGCGRPFVPEPFRRS